MQSWFTVYFFDIGHPSYDQLTPVKTSYMLTSITWPYRGSSLQLIEIMCFFQIDRWPVNASWIFICFFWGKLVCGLRWMSGLKSDWNFLAWILRSLDAIFITGQFLQCVSSYSYRRLLSVFNISFIDRRVIENKPISLISLLEDCWG